MRTTVFSQLFKILRTIELVLSLIITSIGIFKPKDTDIKRCQFIYSVRYGDTTTKIAERYQMSLQELLYLNPQITNPDKIYVKQKLIVQGNCFSMISMNN